MARFPTTVKKSVAVKAPIEKVYAFLWDAVASSDCIVGIDYRKQVAPDTYRCVLKLKSVGPVSLAVQYTVEYEGNGIDTIR